MTRRLLWAVLAACLMSVGLIATDGPLTNLMNLKSRVDENGYLRVSGGTPGVTDGPLTALSNLRGRTDENGYLRISFAGAQTLSGHLLFSPDNTYDIGASGATRPRTGYFGTSVITPIVDSGAASNLLLKYNGTTKVTIATSEAIFADQITGGGAIQAGSSFRWSGGGTLTNVADTDVSVLNSASNAYISLRAQNYKIGTVVMVSGTAPTIASGFGTSPSIVASNGTAAFTVNVGTGGTASTGVLTMPSATTGWRVTCDNTSTNTATVFVTKQTAFTTTSATIGNYDAAGSAAAWVASNVLVCSALAF